MTLNKSAQNTFAESYALNSNHNLISWTIGIIVAVLLGAFLLYPPLAYTQGGITSASLSPSGISLDTVVSVTHTTLDDFISSDIKERTGLDVISMGDGAVRLQKVLRIKSSDWVTDTDYLPRELSNLGAATYGDYLYVAGGLNTFDYPNWIKDDVYVATMQVSGTLTSWTPQITLPQKLMEHALVINDGYIYVLGGQTGLDEDSAVDAVYHARLNTDGSIRSEKWLTTSVSLPHEMSNFAALAYRGRIYVIGGYHGSGTSSYYREVYQGKIDPNGGQITEWVDQAEAHLPIGDECAEAVAIAHADTLYVIGGVRGSTARNQVFSATLTAQGAIVTTTNPVWTESSYNLGDTLRQHAGVINSAGQVFLIGGRYGDGEQDNIYSTIVDASGQIITPWVTMIDALPETRVDHAAVINGDNRLYVIGGIGASGNSVDTIYHANLEEIEGEYVPTGALTGTFYLEGRPEIVKLGIVTTITDTDKTGVSFQYCMADVPGVDQCEDWSTIVYAQEGTSAEATSPDINQNASYIHYRVVLTRGEGYEQDTPYLEEVRLYYDKPTPDVYIEWEEVLPPDHASAGEIIQYKIKYGNKTAGSVAYDAIITETLPEYTTYEGGNWNYVTGTNLYTRYIPEIDFVEDYNSIVFRVRVFTQVEDVNEIVNHAEIQYDMTGLTDPEPDPTNNEINHTLPLTWYNLQIVKVPHMPEVAPGDYLTYSVYITYSGNVVRPIDRLFLYEHLPANTSYAGPDSIIEGGWVNTPTGSITYYRNLGAWDPATMGNSRRATFTVQVSPEAVISITNKVILEHFYSDADIKESTTNDNEFVISTDISSAYISLVSKLPSENRVASGDLITYVIRYHSGGASMGVVLTDTLPQDTTFVDGSVGTGAGWTDIGGRRYRLDLGTVESGDGVVTISIQVSPDLAEGELVNHVEIGSADDGSSGDDEVDAPPVEVFNAVDLGVIKDDGDDERALGRGQTVDYPIEYFNQGTTPANNVVLTETLPENTVYISNGLGWQVVETDHIYIYNDPALPRGVSRTVTMTVLITDSAPKGPMTNTVAIDYDGAYGEDVNLDNNIDTNVDMVSTILFALDKTAAPLPGALVHPGDLITYTLFYSNTGFDDAIETLITDVLPLHTEFVSSPICTVEISQVNCPLSTVLSGGTGAVSFTVRVVDPITAAAQYIANSDYLIVNPEMQEVGAEIITHSISATVSLTITKTAMPASEVRLGDTITYTLNYTNDGNTILSGIIVTDRVPDGTEFVGASTECTYDAPILTCMPLDSNASGTFTFAVTVAVNEGQIVNDDYRVTSAYGGDNSGAAVVNDVLPLSSTLQVSKDDGRVEVQPDDILTYMIVYTNTGAVSATGVALTETIPEETTYQGDGWNLVSGRVYTFDVGEMAAGATNSTTMRVSVDAEAMGELVNTVVIGSDDAAIADIDTDVDEIPAPVQLQVSKSDGQIKVVPGDLITYVIHYTNAGSTAATGVILTETIPDNTIYQPSGWTAIDALNYTLSIGDLDPDETGSTTMVVSVANDAVGQLTNYVYIGSETIPNANSDTDVNTVETVVLTPDLSIELNRAPGQARVRPGDIATFTIEYQNSGLEGSVATGVVLTASLPNYLSLVGSWTSVGQNRYVYEVGSLPVGEVYSMSFLVLVDEDIPVADLCTNLQLWAYIGGAETEEVEFNNESDAALTVCRPDLRVSKENGVAAIIVDSQAVDVVYGISYYNDEDGIKATGVVLTETLPDWVSFGEGNSGWQDRGNKVYTFDVGEVAAGETATVPIRVTVQEDTPIGTYITNTVDIGDDGIEREFDNNIVYDSDPVYGPGPNLFVTLDDSIPEAHAGDILRYTINYGNKGSQSATDVTLTELLPNGMVHTGGSACWVNQGGGNYSCQLPALDINASGSLTFAAQVQEIDRVEIPLLTNTVQIAHATGAPDTDPLDNTAHDVNHTIPDLRVIDITSSPSDPQRGEEVVISVVVQNQGATIQSFDNRDPAADGFWMDLYDYDHYNLPAIEDITPDTYSSINTFWAITENISYNGTVTRDSTQPYKVGATPLVTLTQGWHYLFAQANTGLELFESPAGEQNNVFGPVEVFVSMPSGVFPVVSEIDPITVCNDLRTRYQNLNIYGENFEMGYERDPDPAIPTVQFRRVSPVQQFNISVVSRQSDTHLRASIPQRRRGLPSGEYDIVVINPSGEESAPTRVTVKRCLYYNYLPLVTKNYPTYYVYFPILFKNYPYMVYLPILLKSY